MNRAEAKTCNGQINWRIKIVEGLSFAGAEVINKEHHEWKYIMSVVTFSCFHLDFQSFEF